MGPDLSLTRLPACPSCGAALRPDSPWCTLCYADLRPSAPPETSYGATDPLTGALPALHAAEPPVEPLATAPLVPAPAGPLDDRSWPCSRCATRNPLEASACTACGAGFLAAVRDEEGPLLVLPGVGDLTRMSRPRRLGLAAGLVAAVLVPLAIITTLLTKAPPTTTTVPAAPVATLTR